VTDASVQLCNLSSLSQTSVRSSTGPEPEMLLRSSSTRVSASLMEDSLSHLDCRCQPSERTSCSRDDDAETRQSSIGYPRNRGIPRVRRTVVSTNEQTDARRERVVAEARRDARLAARVRRRNVSALPLPSEFAQRRDVSQLLKPAD